MKKPRFLACFARSPITLVSVKGHEPMHNGKAIASWEPTHFPNGAIHYSANSGIKYIEEKT